MKNILLPVCFSVWIVSFIGWIVALRKEKEFDIPTPMRYQIVMTISGIGMFIVSNFFD